MTATDEHTTAPARGPVAALIDDWQEARKALRAIEEAEHPDITDVLGRVWKWWKGDLYVHDKMGWPKSLITQPDLRRPIKAALDNPNYRWCAICKGDADE
jgi:hypothetical protein